MAHYETEYSITGDCSEEFKDIKLCKGRAYALLWIWGQVIYALFAWGRIFFAMGGAMLKNYFKITLRNLKRHKSYSIINIAGLAVGMAAFLLISFYVLNELSYDRFHKDADNIYLVLRGENDFFMAPTSKLLAPVLKTELPEVIDSTCFSRVPGTEKLMVRYQDKFFEEDINLTDSNFFKIFSFSFHEGNPDLAFESPNSLLLTKKAADKYFGNRSPLGKTVQIYMFGKKVDMKITGVLEDIPENTHFYSNMFIHYDLVRSLGLDWDRWDNQILCTYVQIREGSDVQSLPNKIREIEIKNHKTFGIENVTYDLLPVTKIHLYGNNIKFLSTSGDIKYIYIFSVAAFIILLIAGINYMNLSTAFSLKRTKEVGVRKVAGASRNLLVRQFLGETIILSFIALILAVVLAQLFLPSFNRISGKSLSIPHFSPIFILGTLLVWFIISFFSGFYPALFLSAFKPVILMKIKSTPKMKGVFFRKGLLLFQFSLSIILIVSTLVVYNQLFFVRNTPLGYDKDHILCIKIRGDVSQSYEALKNELLNNPDVLNVSRSEPLKVNSMVNTDGVYWRGKLKNPGSDFRILRTDYNFLSTYGIELKEGRFYSQEFSSDQTDAYVINETAAKNMGMDSPLGNEIRLWGRRGSIIGVVKDFIFGSFHRAIEPLIFIIPSEQNQDLFLRLVSIRFKPDALLGSMRFIEETWTRIYPDIPFDYYFMDDAVNTQYRSEEQMGTLFKYFTFLALIIACLGLYGLTALSAERKIKEIGIRKVLGASVSNLAVLLSKEYMIWVAVANLIAWPVAWFVMKGWLQNFAYRTTIHWWIFILAGGMGFGIALLTVFLLTIKAVQKNPVESLRYE